MWLEALIERLGEAGTLALGALLIGLVFGFMAQRSRFCLRSAVIEFARRQPGGKLTVWLFAFATAMAATQLLALAGLFDASTARQIAARGSLSGAAVGGLLFGSSRVSRAAPACAATSPAPWPWVSAACWPGAVPWAPASRVRPCSRSRRG